MHSPCLLLCTLVILFVSVNCQNETEEEVTSPPSIVNIAEGQFHCPKADDAVTTCDAANSFYYYECCGKLDMYCCLKFREWFWIVIIVVGALFAIGVVLCCIRCICCTAKRSSSYDF